jgi:hypothetical protein
MLFAAVLFAGVVSGWIVIVQFYLRHAGLTALTLMAPLPVAAAGYWLAARFEIEAAPVFAAYAYLFALICLQLTFGRIARTVCDGSSKRDGVATALVSVVIAIGTTAGALALSMLAFVAISSSLMDGLAAIVLMLAAFAFAIVAGWSARWLPYSERFIANANSARERRERPIARFARVAEPRWSISFAGIAIILATIAAFGARPLDLRGLAPAFEIRLAAVVIIIFVIQALGIRNWRLAVAQVLTLSFEVLLGLWSFSQGRMPLFGEDAITMGLMIAIAATPLAILASSTAGYLREGDRADIALLRSMQEDGPGSAVAAALLAISCPAALFAGSPVRFQIAVALACAPCAILIFPAFGAAIYWLLPAYRSVEDVFGKR